MSDTASGSHSVRPSPAEGESIGSTRELPKSLPGNSSLPTEQPTVISSQPPLSAPSHAEVLCTVRPDRLAPGTSLGQYELLEYVGGGGMGHVYRATDKALGRTVALKVLSTEQVADSETLLRFRNEARSAARLNHENIVQVYHAGEEQGVSYIAFEFIEGTNIRDLVAQKGPLSLAEAISYTLQIAEALAYASRHNIVHRDIKPSNVLITPEGRAKLIDMGLARLQGPNPTEDLTASGVTLGTFDYISPEQARDPRNADVRSDIYSLGCTLFFMLSGRPPFPDGTVLQKLLQHQGDEPPDVRQFRPDLPEELSWVLRRMMAKSPQQRYEDPPKLIESLFGLIQQVGLQPAGPGQRVWVTPKPSKAAMLQRHLPWLAPVVILLGVGLVLHFLWDTPVPENSHLSPTAATTAEKGPKDTRRPTQPAHGMTAPASVATKTPSATPPQPAMAAVPSPSAAPPTPPVAPASDTAVPAQGTAPSSLAGSTALSNSSGMPTSPPTGQGVTAPPSGASVSATVLLESGISLSEPRPPSQAGANNPAVAANQVASSGAPAPATPRDRVLVVDGQGKPNCFASLKAACAAAGNGDVIELRYSGRIQPETPITLANLRLTIRAGEGFQPVVSFRPNESDPVRYRRSMFSLPGSRVALFNLALELSIPEDLPPDSWALFDLDQAETIELKQSSLTICNAAGGWAANNPDVAFLRLKASPFPEAIQGESRGQRRLKVTLEDCVARGEAVFLRNEGLQPFELEWNNGMLSTTEWLLSADGSAAQRPNDTMQITLDHLTALIGLGLCQFNHTDYVPDALADLRVSNSILVGSGSSVLLEQSNVADVDRARQRISWDADRNFYEGFHVFWSISPRDASRKSEQMDFDSWLGHWTLDRENNASCDLVQWKGLPQKDRAVHMHAPVDFALDDTPTNAAITAAKDGENAGMVLERLPQVPSFPRLFGSGPSSVSRSSEAAPGS